MSPVNKLVNFHRENRRRRVRRVAFILVVWALAAVIVWALVEMMQVMILTATEP